MTKRKHQNSNANSNSKKQKAWKKPYIKFSPDLPKFLDAESNVTASRFGARRLPEMKKMWQSVLQSSEVNHDDAVYYKSGGCKVSKRHLRRRTGSHNRKRRHRFPSGKIESDEVNTDGDKSSPSSENMSSGVSAHATENGTDNLAKSRRARRKPQLLRAKHSQWKKSNTNRTNGNSAADGISASENSQPTATSQWLETHLWHSKRFHMSPPLSIYNHWRLPLGHTNRGSRAGLRLAKTKSTIQDATWTIAGRSIILQIKNKSSDDLLDIVESMCGGNRMHSAPFLLDEKVILGLQAAYGLVYELGCNFPLGVVGPASFIFVKNGEVSFVRICADGSIIDKVEDIASEIVNEFKEDNIECLLSTEATALIRVRGVEATKVITRSLSMRSLRQNMDWTKMSEKSNLHTSLPHRTMLKVQFESEQKHSFNEDDAIIHSSSIDIEYLHTIQERDVEEKNYMLKSPQLGGNDIILISQMPNSMEGEDTSPNCVVSGWDIICPPALVSPIFRALNHIGGACAIGYVEDSCNRMEAEPPLPVWPRDFPDTEVGREYWTGRHDEWNVLRYCIEEGFAGGRIKTGLKRMLSKCNEEHADAKQSNITTGMPNIRDIDWEGIESSDALEESVDERKTIVLVRGGFMTPFIQALNGFGQHYINTISDEKNQTRRRPRRKVQANNRSIVLPPIGEDLLEEHNKFCATLLNSLSLPALLRCHLVVEGKGTLRPGMTIACKDVDGESAESESKQILGYVGAGGFSQTRGNFHGVGIVSSKVFLFFLRAEGHGRFMSVDRYGQRTTAIRVAVHDANIQSKSTVIASLTLLD